VTRLTRAIIALRRLRLTAAEIAEALGTNGRSRSRSTG
jgi:hypothetical protein